MNLSDDELKAIESQLLLTDEQFLELAQVARSNFGGGMALKKHSLPLLDSKLSMLAWFNETLRNQILEVKMRVGLLNEGADETRYYLNLTFQNISHENYKIAEGNMIRSCKMYASQARDVVDLIGKIKIN